MHTSVTCVVFCRRICPSIRTFCMYVDARVFTSVSNGGYCGSAGLSECVFVIITEFWVDWDVSGVTPVTLGHVAALYTAVSHMYGRFIPMLHLSSAISLGDSLC